MAKRKTRTLARHTRRPEFPCDFPTACNILYAVMEKRWSQSKTAFYFCVHSGTVSKIVRGLSHHGSTPRSF